MPTSNYYHPQADEYRKLGITPPESHVHGTEEDIRSRLKPVMPTNWHMEGNQLIGYTEMGKLSQTIPTDYICHGVDDNGMPILKRVEL